MDETDITSSPLSSLPLSPTDSVFNVDLKDEAVPPPAMTKDGLTLMEQLLKFEEETKQEEARSRAASDASERKKARGSVGGRDEESDDDLPETKRRKVTPSKKGTSPKRATPPKRVSPRNSQTKVTIHVSPTPATKLSTSTKKPVKDKKWEAPFVYTDEKSPLTEADLRAILLLPEAWDILTEDEKKDILAKFPDDTHIQNAGTADVRPNIESLRNDDDFRHDCARYVENIELGKHDEDWLYQAWVAHEKHKRGDFDAFLKKSFEDEWDVKLSKEGGDQGSSGSSDNSSSPSGSPTAASKMGGLSPTYSLPTKAKITTEEDSPTKKTEQPAEKTKEPAAVPEVTESKVTAEEGSPSEKTEQPAAVPEVAANGT